jgi:hypothetical protein
MKRKGFIEEIFFMLFIGVLALYLFIWGIAGEGRTWRWESTYTLENGVILNNCYAVEPNPCCGMQIQCDDGRVYECQKNVITSTRKVNMT